jgi:hypothetical protein
VYRSTQALHGSEPDAGGDVRHAARFAVCVAAAAAAVLGLAVVWVGTCGGSTADTVACGTAQRTVLALGAPMILLAGGTWAFFRTYRVWRGGGTWWPWQGAGWLLVISMLVMLTTSLPGIAGTALGG